MFASRIRSSHCEIAPNGDALTITIRPPGKWIKRASGMLFVMLWILTGGIIITQLTVWLVPIIRNLPAAFPVLFAVLRITGPYLPMLLFFWWLLGWLTWLLLWNTASTERVTVTEHTITIEKRMLVFHRTRTYSSRYIRRLRVGKAVFYQSSHRFSLFPHHSFQAYYYPVAFDYGVDTIRFGYAITASISNHLLTTIQKHFPAYTLIARDRSIRSLARPSAPEAVPPGVVSPAPTRYTIEDHGDSFTVTIPAQRAGALIAFLLVMAPLWLQVGWLLLAALWHPNRAIAACALGILIVWAISGLDAIYLLLWQLTGSEVITVDAQAITVRKAILGSGRTRIWQAASIRRIRVIQDTLRFYDLPTITSYPLAFDHHEKTIYIGHRASEAENRQLLEAIRLHFPHYGNE